MSKQATTTTPVTVDDARDRLAWETHLLMTGLREQVASQRQRRGPLATILGR